MKRLLFTIILSLICFSSVALAEEVTKENLFPVDISGKVFDKNGNLFNEEVLIKITAEITFPDAASVDGVGSREESYEFKVSNGHFSWSGKASYITVTAEKEGYHRISVKLPRSKRIIEEEDGFPVRVATEITSRDTILYLIPKGVSSKLEYTENAYIPDLDEKQSFGKQCGWSFAKRWYYPVDKDVPVDIVLDINENNQHIYTMKEPGGFVYCPGLPQRESALNELYNNFNLMPEAPEDGYVQTICPADNADKEQGDIYYYFKTPDGKYGKIAFRGYIDYYINPDGSRDLEVDKFLYRPPLNPDVKHMPDDNEAYSPDEY